ncbi:MAG: metallophosphoesterase [Acidobacteria bacterium]|nr:metallophosphoesterase [Acidobacteriota bacterium]MCI0721981.1 metallophosphoesterase [Acidobacteriota bacterium]
MSFTRREFIWKAGAGLIGGAVTTGFYAWRIEPHWVEVVEHSLPVAHLPAALVGKRLIQISDLHVGPRVDDGYLMATLDRVRDLRPDLLAITGDFVSYRSAGTLQQLDRVLSHLPRGKRATLAILGNHDYGYGWSQVIVADQITARLRHLGVVVLRNERCTVDGLEVVGLDDFWGPHFSPQKVMSGLETTRPALVLCHNPDAVDRPVWGGYRGWILSGHTHGGQCKPPFLPPPILPTRNKRYTAGEFDLGNGRRLYINRGLGHLIQVRFNARPEVTVFTLDRA